MDKKKFNNLKVLQQIEYVNNELEKGESLRKISENLIMNKKTFQNRFIKVGYIYNKELNQYAKDNTIDIQTQSNTKVSQKARMKVITTIEDGNTKELQRYDNTKALQRYDDAKGLQKYEDIIELQKYEDTIELQKYANDILELIKYKDELLEMLKDYKNNTNVIQQLDINSLPQEMKKGLPINKSIKVYKPVYKLFDEVCSQYSSNKKQDLISLALLEFYNKYKK